MKFKNTVIKSFDYFLPENILTSDELESRLSPVYERLRLPKGRLEMMTGISERRYWEPGTRPSSLSSEAAKRLIEKNNINKNEIDLLIHASVCRDFLEPSTASVVHSNLDLSPHCQFFDLSNACLGVMNSFVMAASMIESGLIKNALIVSGENGGPLLEETINFLNNNKDLTRKSIKKYIANLTIGSAAVAFHLCHKDLAPGGHEILGGVIQGDSSANVLCQGDGDTTGLMMETDSEELMLKGVELAKTTWEKTKVELNDYLSLKDHWVLTHQVGSAHEALTLKTLKLEKNKTYKTYNTLGNTGSAALPITLCKLAETGELQKDEILALLGIGSGLSSIMLGLKW